MDSSADMLLHLPIFTTARCFLACWIQIEHDYVWAGSACSGDCFEELLYLGQFESLIHEKGARKHLLSDSAKKLNRIKSAIRAWVEHVFGCMTMSMGRKLTRKI
jgi:IS5 family transposase